MHNCKFILFQNKGTAFAQVTEDGDVRQTGSLREWCVQSMWLNSLIHNRNETQPNIVLHTQIILISGGGGRRCTD
jgi:hypothetical protein